jgi:hypothetical protein
MIEEKKINLSSFNLEYFIKQQNNIEYFSIYKNLQYIGDLTPFISKHILYLLKINDISIKAIISGSVFDLSICSLQPKYVPLDIYIFGPLNKKQVLINYLKNFQISTFEYYSMNLLNSLSKKEKEKQKDIENIFLLKYILIVLILHNIIFQILFNLEI